MFNVGDRVRIKDNYPYDVDPKEVTDDEKAWRGRTGTIIEVSRPYLVELDIVDVAYFYPEELEAE